MISKIVSLLKRKTISTDYSFLLVIQLLSSRINGNQKETKGRQTENRRQRSPSRKKILRFKRESSLKIGIWEKDLEMKDDDGTSIVSYDELVILVSRVK
jgi:hypothetical protein